MNVHLFGNGPSPAVATFGLRKTAADGEEEFGENAAEFVHRNFYVDDGLASRPTTKEAIDLVTATTDYVEFMGKTIEKGHASPVPIEEITKPQSGRVWYLPHFGVYHPMKPFGGRQQLSCVTSNRCSIPFTLIQSTETSYVFSGTKTIHPANG